ncbi:pyrophosphatase [Tanacetum coccineum]
MFLNLISSHRHSWLKRYHWPCIGIQIVIISIFAIAISIFVSFSFAAMYGIAAVYRFESYFLGSKISGTKNHDIHTRIIRNATRKIVEVMFLTLNKDLVELTFQSPKDGYGMLSIIATRLAIDVYGPISDTAEMVGMNHRIRERTDALDAAAIGKGFSIGSAALVSLALFGAFVSRAGVQTVDVLTPKVFIGIIVGAILPYGFLAMTMKSVGCVALKMVEDVRRQFNTIPGFMEGLTKPDYTTCVKISTDATGKI